MKREYSFKPIYSLKTHHKGLIAICYSQRQCHTENSAHFTLFMYVGNSIPTLDTWLPWIKATFTSIEEISFQNLT